MAQAIARVWPLVTTRALAGPLDYRVDDEFEGAVTPGALLVVPLGRRQVVGVVGELADQSAVPADRLRSPRALLAEALPEHLVGFCRWLAARYCSTPARAFALALPPGIGRGGGAERRRRIVAELTAAGSELLAAADGAGVATPLGALQRRLLAALAAGPQSAEALDAAIGRPARPSLLRLERRGLVRVRRSGTVARPAATAAVGRAHEAASRLTADQERALAAIERALAEPAPAPLLLHGVTGSGKTEVYLRAAARCLEQGRDVLVLVPEIALAPQTVARFRARFGDTVALLHSGLPAAARRGEWERLRSGRSRICVGARSALFAPLARLGLVVVDEEHDDAYKQDQDPRYDARRAAEELARRSGALLLAGSATPRVDSFVRWRRIELSRRADGSALPPVEVVAAPAPGRLTQTAVDALEELVRRRGKAIVLLNRRGFAPYASCRSCGETLGCPNCDVALVYHRAQGALRCHHCGHAEALRGRCRNCGSVSLALAGAGTEQLEAALRAIVAPLPVFRLDADTATGASDELLARFEAADAGVLVGTQLVAKGHDFAGIELGLVVAADAALAIPDYRAQERVFQLVTQLAGRVGRGGCGGRVIVQARDPNARALRYAANHDSTGFVREESEWRRTLGYPPFVELVYLELHSTTAGRELAAADALRAALAERGVQALGPAPLFRRAGKYRARLVVKAAPPADAEIGAVREAVDALVARRSFRDVAVAVDVDPC